MTDILGRLANHKGVGPERRTSVCCGTTSGQVESYSGRVNVTNVHSWITLALFLYLKI